jgi:hypothetical protein
MIEKECCFIETTNEVDEDVPSIVFTQMQSL